MPQVYERSPIAALYAALDGGLEAGQLGVIVAKTGVGKSALLVHIALDALLRDRKVLHITLRDSVDHVVSHYDEVFRAATQNSRLRDRTGALVAAERHRMIHSYAGRGFDTAHLAANLDMLAEVASFAPELVVVDSVHEVVIFEQLAALARERGLKLWVTLRHSEGVPEIASDHAAVALRLVPSGRTVKIMHQGETLPIHLDPTTMLVMGPEVDGGKVAHRAPRPADCTLYSGGANGSESTFGEVAERYGIHEVSFTFDGHKQGRTKGRYALSPLELKAGDVSLIYVSRRLNRTYSEGSLIRKVLQTLWHMVSRSQQVFVIGKIQEDGTVTGGTGWSVELARMWNKDLWVFDQEVAAWHRWDGDEWVVGTPIIESIHFTGTGTRYLNEAGKAAIESLFQRSFLP